MMSATDVTINVLCYTREPSGTTLGEFLESPISDCVVELYDSDGVTLLSTQSSAEGSGIASFVDVDFSGSVAYFKVLYDNSIPLVAGAWLPEFGNYLQSITIDTEGEYLVSSRVFHDMFWGKGCLVRVPLHGYIGAAHATGEGSTTDRTFYNWRVLSGVTGSITIGQGYKTQVISSHQTLTTGTPETGVIFSKSISNSRTLIGTSNVDGEMDFIIPNDCSFSVAVPSAGVNITNVLPLSFSNTNYINIAEIKTF